MATSSRLHRNDGLVHWAVPHKVSIYANGRWLFESICGGYKRQVMRTNVEQLTCRKCKDLLAVDGVVADIQNAFDSNPDDF